jgi:hypothetical protein
VDCLALTPRGALPFGSPSCAAAYSGEPLRSDENEASVIKARTSVVSIASRRRGFFFCAVQETPRAGCRCYCGQGNFSLRACMTRRLAAKFRFSG